jgi:hypothetical protein
MFENAFWMLFMESKITRSCFAIGFLVLLPTTAYSWGALGHQAISSYAEKQLNVKSLQKIQQLLAQEPGSTLASISTWADEHRNPTTAAWHYVNFPRGDCVYQPQRDYPDGRCVIEAIGAQITVLKSSVDDFKKLQALKYVIHFMGDIHQPLHAGYADDRGGNQYQLQVFMRGSNLHSFWDSGLIKQESEDVEVWVQKLSTLNAANKTLMVSVPEMAQESCQVVALEGYYPGRLIDGDYVKRFGPVAARRMQQAGDRLATMLNQVFR